jgi:hypothetical protein
MNEWALAALIRRSVNRRDQAANEALKRLQARKNEVGAQNDQVGMGRRDSVDLCERDHRQLG